MDMKLNIPTLDKWAVFNDVLVGEAINHPDFEKGQRVMTNKVLTGSKKDGWIKCVGDEDWQLGQPGNLGMYVDPITKRFY